MDDTLAQKAINSALKNDWNDAVKTNIEILSNCPDDIDSLNRLAKAYAETGKIDKAKKIALKTLKIDPTNSIAKKCLEKWSLINNNSKSAMAGALITEAFLEDPGRTRIVSLINTGDKKIIAELDCADELKLNTRGHKISVCTNDGKYLGRLPDDISARLKTLIKYDYEYKVCVKTSSQNEIKVFIREIKRGLKTNNTPSFSSEKIDYVAFTSPEMVHRNDSVLSDSDSEETESA